MFKKPAPPDPGPPPPPPPARRVTDTVETAVTVIGRGLQIKGDLSGGDSVDLAGSLEGNSEVAGLFRVRQGARVVGDVQAKNIVIDGEVSAETLVAEKVEIGVSARVRGNVRAHVVAIAEGAFFDGQVDMVNRDGVTAPTAFVEKRKRS